MDERLALRIILGILGILALTWAYPARGSVGLFTDGPAPAAQTLPAFEPSIEPWAPVTAPPRAAVSVRHLDVPDKCDRLVRRVTDDGERLTKARPAWLRHGPGRWRRQQELRRTIRAIADEMGADELAAEMIWRKAIYESSGNPGNVHIHTRDQAANLRAASKGRRRATKRWRRAEIPVDIVRDGHVIARDRHDAWALGRGLYGQVTGLHMHRWSADAPPWSLCDPVIATVTVIWSMRAGLAECDGSTLRDAYRRFSSGKCARRRESLERRFDVLARGKVGGLALERFDPDAPAVLGERWPEANTSRVELLGVMAERLQRE